MANGGNYRKAAAEGAVRGGVSFVVKKLLAAFLAGGVLGFGGGFAFADSDDDSDDRQSSVVQQDND